MRLLARLLIPVVLAVIVVFAAITTAPSNRSNTKSPAERVLFSNP